jgi:hypothetical protein
MDTNDLKGRIAETLVESILCRASYRVALAGRENRVRDLLKVTPAESFMPDLLAWRQMEDGPAVAPRLVPIEIRYRADVGGALRLDASKLAKEAEQWPDIYFVFVTENPERGRSCFQVVDPSQHPAGTPWHTVDLHEVPDLDIYWHTVEEYECLVKMIFPLLSGSTRASVGTRKAMRRLPARITALRVSR